MKEQRFPVPDNDLHGKGGELLASKEFCADAQAGSHVNGGVIMDVLHRFADSTLAKVSTPSTALPLRLSMFDPMVHSRDRP